MAIGTLAAIGLAVGGIGSAVSGISKANSIKNAANQAADATTQAADKSAAVIRENYQDSAAALQPWQASGLAANNTINSFLGLTPTQAPQPAQQPTQQPNALSQYGAPTSVDGRQNWASLTALGIDPATWGSIDPNNYNGTPYLSQQTGIAAQQPAAPTVSAKDGFKQYIANSDYGFQFGQGANKVNSGYAGAGTLQSGAAMKGLEDYRQNLQQGYRGEYLGALGNQQSIGSAAAAAQAGVSQNMGNSLATIFTNQGANLANAALAKSGASTGGAIGNTLGLLGGGIFGLGK